MRSPTSVIHWIGVFLLFLSSILLLVVTLSAPVGNDIGLLRVILTNKTDIRHSSVTFGTFGYCVLDVPPVQTDQDWCSHRSVGYAPAKIMAAIDKTSFSQIGQGTSDGLTRVMILHPIACVLAFFAFLVSIGAGVIGSLGGVLVGSLAWLFVLISVAVDFALFGIIKRHVNRDGSGSRAHYGSAIWLLLTSLITLFFGIIIVFFTCFRARREKNRGTTRTKSEAYPLSDTTRAPRRKRFGIF